jgi:hypothetical protein
MKTSNTTTSQRGRGGWSEEKEGTGVGITCVGVTGEMVGTRGRVEEKRSQLGEIEQIGGPGEKKPPLLGQIL